MLNDSGNKSIITKADENPKVIGSQLEEMTKPTIDEVGKVWTATGAGEASFQAGGGSGGEITQNQFAEINCLYPPVGLSPVVKDTDSSSQLQAIFNYAKTNGVRRIYLPAGKYEFNDVSISDYSFEFYGDGMDTIIKRGSSTSKGIIFSATALHRRAVSSISVSGKNTVIDIDTATAFKVGDIVKIISSEVVEGCRLSTSYKGEFKVVRRVDLVNHAVEVGGKLRYSHTVSPKLALVKDVSFNIHDLSLTTDLIKNNISTLANVISINGGQYHKLENIRVFDCNDTGIAMNGCYGYSAKKIIVDYQENYEDAEGTSTSYGYGFVERNGGFFDVEVNSKYTRHGFTTASSALGTFYAESYGVSEHGKVRGFGQGASNSAFDLHEESNAVSFVDCMSNDANFYGMQLRGENNIIDGCTSVNDAIGLHIFNYSGTTCKGNHSIRNSLFKSNSQPLSVFGDTVILENINVTNTTFEGNAQIDIDNAEMNFNNCIFEIVGRNNIFTLKRTTDLSFQNCTFVFNNAGDTDEHYLFSLINGASADISLTDCIVKSKTNDMFTFKLLNALSGSISSATNITFYNSTLLNDTINIIGSTDIEKWVSGESSSINTLSVKNISPFDSGISVEWQEYTPTITWGTAVPLGITTTARYTVIGKIAKVMIRVQATDGNGTSGTAFFTLPITPKIVGIQPPINFLQKINTAISTRYGYIEDNGVGNRLRAVFSTVAAGSTLDVSISADYEIS